MSRGGGARVARRVLAALLVGPGVCGAQTGMSATAGVSLFRHQVNFGYGVEESSGLVLGAAAAMDVSSRLSVAIRVAGGSLSTTATGAENRDVGEVGVEARVAPARWLAFRGGATSRSYSTAIARQRWNTIELGAEAHLDFATTPVRGIVGATLLPVVSVNGLPRPDLALGAAAGIEYRTDPITIGVFYGLERYDFRDEGTGRRLEQVDTLTFRLTARRHIGTSRAAR